ncbi:MAG: helix-turn-helix domain-containing protein [Solirubrobacteraceae bacterium]
MHTSVRPSPPTTASTHGILDPGRAQRTFGLERIAPEPDVGRWIERTWTTWWDLPPGVEHRQAILPHPCVNLVVYPAVAEVAAPDALPGPAAEPMRTVVMVHGIVRGVDTRRLRGRGRAVGVTFRPGAFSALSSLGPDRLAERPVTLAEAFGPGGAELAAELVDRADDPSAVAEAVADLVRDRAPDEDPGLDLLHAVIADMLRRGPRGRVIAVAADHGVSVRTLQRLFRARVGVGPKWVMQRHRVHEAATRIATEGVDLAALAVDLGYTDQAHMTGDFRAAVGMTPAAYARACRAG